MTITMFINFHFLVPKSLPTKLALNDTVVSEKEEFPYVNDFRAKSSNDLDLS